MRSFVYWIGGTLIGALAGYGLALFMNIYIPVAVFAGSILGSTTAITIRILRAKNADLNETDDSPHSATPEEPM